MSSPASNGEPRGIILIVVLWVIAMMTVVVVALSAFAQKNAVLTGVDTDRLRSELALQSGLEIAAAMILARAPEERALFRGEAVTADIGGGRMVEISIGDAAALVDINRADPELLTAVVGSLDIDEDQGKLLLGEIAKRREAMGGKEQQPSDRQPGDGQQVDRRQQPGQQDENAQAEEEAQKQPPPAFFSPLQLYGLDGIEPETVDKILPLITVYSSDGKVNPLAATEAVLELVPNMAPDEIETLQDARDRKQWKTPPVQNVLAAHEAFLAIGESRVFVIGVKAVSGRGLIAGGKLQATVILDEGGQLPFQTLAWSW